MAKVLVIVKVMPESVDTDLEGLQKAISKKLPSKISVKRVEIEDIAFGIRALKLSLLLPDEAGGTDLIEETIKGVNGVSDVQIDFVSRV